MEGSGTFTKRLSYRFWNEFSDDREIILIDVDIRLPSTDTTGGDQLTCHQNRQREKEKLHVTISLCSVRNGATVSQMTFLDVFK